MKQQEHQLGDAPIEPEYAAKMAAVARAIDEFFNGELRGNERPTGFVLLVFPFGDRALQLHQQRRGPPRHREDVSRPGRALRGGGMTSNTRKATTMDDERPGPTGTYPAGKLRPDDEGGINILARVDRARRVIFLDFTTPCRWLALPAADARRVAAQLIAMADQLEPPKPSGNNRYTWEGSGGAEEKKL